MLNGTSPEWCSDAHYQYIERLALALSEDLMATSKHYGAHGWGGIFSRGAGGFDYKQTKSRFIFDELCKWSRQRSSVTTVCEVGFMAGHTSMLFLEVASRARVVSFDLGQEAMVPWLCKQSQRLAKAYGKRWLGVVKGDSRLTVPYYAKQQQPPFKCDVSFVDGGKTVAMRYTDYLNFNKLSYPGALLFFDEATSLGCVNGSAPHVDHCRYQGGLGGKHLHDKSTVHSAMGTYRAAREGVFSVEKCRWTPGMEEANGVCAAHFATIDPARVMKREPWHGRTAGAVAPAAGKLVCTDKRLDAL